MSATGSWTPLSIGLTGQSVNAIAINNDYIYVGGNYTQAGSIPANNIALWKSSHIIGTFSYEFTYIVSAISPPVTIDQAYFSKYIPIINTGNSFVYTPTIIYVDNLDGTYFVTVSISYTYTENDSLVDGLSFNSNSCVFFYNNYTIQTFTITQFGNIPLSRAGYQFYNLYSIFYDSLLTNDIPTILSAVSSINGSSLSYCFANVGKLQLPNPNSNPPLGFNLNILSWDIQNATDVSFIFKNSGFYNTTNFSLNITNITTLESMFNIALLFTPDVVNFINQPPVTMQQSLSKYSVDKSKVTATIKNLKRLFYGCKSFKPSRFTYGRYLTFGFSKLSKLQTAIPDYNEDLTDMFNGCTQFNPSTAFTFFANPIDTTNMFKNCTNFNKPIDNINFTYITTAQNMFYNASSFNHSLPTDTTGLKLSLSSTYYDELQNANGMFAGASSYDNASNPIPSSLNSLTQSANIFAETLLSLSQISNYFTFSYSFILSVSYPDSYETTLSYFPILNTDRSFGTDPLSPTIIMDSNRLVTVTYVYLFNPIYATTLDGLTFNKSGFVTFYNTYTTELTILQFNGIPLSRNGYQFASLNSIQFSSGIVAPTILPNTYLTNCFYNSTAFNSDISGWNTIGAINMDSMFLGADAFSQDLSSWTIANVLTSTNFSNPTPIFGTPPGWSQVGVGDDYLQFGGNVNTVATSPDGKYVYIFGYSIQAPPYEVGALWNNETNMWSPLIDITTIPGSTIILNGIVQSSVVDASGNLYIGGATRNLLSIVIGDPPYENYQANTIAKWTVATSQWSVLTDSLGNTGVTNMAYNPTRSTYGENVSAIAIAQNGDLYFGGIFCCAGIYDVSNNPVIANNIIRWDGTNWHALIDSQGGNGVLFELGYSIGVMAMTFYNNSLYVGGFISVAGSYYNQPPHDESFGTLAVNNITIWDGSNWSTVGSGPNNGVYGATVSTQLQVSAISVSRDGTYIYVCGYFLHAIDENGNETNVNGSAVWNNVYWSAVNNPNDNIGIYDTNGSTGINATVYCTDNFVFMGGYFNIAGNSPANSITKWDGTNWSIVGPGVNETQIQPGQFHQTSTVRSIAIYDRSVYVGGDFNYIGDQTYGTFALWTEPVYIPYALPNIPPIITVSGTGLYSTINYGVYTVLTFYSAVDPFLVDPFIPVSNTITNISSTQVEFGYIIVGGGACGGDATQWGGSAGAVNYSTYGSSSSQLASSQPYTIQVGQPGAMNGQYPNTNIYYNNDATSSYIGNGAIGATGDFNITSEPGNILGYGATGIGYTIGGPALTTSGAGGACNFAIGGTGENGTDGIDLYPFFGTEIGFGATGIIGGGGGGSNGLTGPTAPPCGNGGAGGAGGGCCIFYDASGNINYSGGMWGQGGINYCDLSVLIGKDGKGAFVGAGATIGGPNTGSGGGGYVSSVTNSSVGGSGLVIIYYKTVPEPAPPPTPA